MAKIRKKDCVGKFVIAFDTICDGWQCATDENEKPDPELFESELDAKFEVFGDAISMLENQTEEERHDNEISPELWAEMKALWNGGDCETQDLVDFLNAHPECNYNEEFVVPATDFIFERQAIYGEKGLQIHGKHLWQL